MYIDFLKIFEVFKDFQRLLKILPDFQAKFEKIFEIITDS